MLQTQWWSYVDVLLCSLHRQCACSHSEWKRPGNRGKGGWLLAHRVNADESIRTSGRMSTRTRRTSPAKCFSSDDLRGVARARDVQSRATSRSLPGRTEVRA